MQKFCPSIQRTDRNYFREAAACLHDHAQDITDDCSNAFQDICGPSGDDCDFRHAVEGPGYGHDKCKPAQNEYRHKCYEPCAKNLVFYQGKCINFQTDPDNCGDIGNQCDVPGGDPCVEGQCEATCPDQGQTTDCAGSCADLTSDPQNCGACGKSCRSSETCASGVCTPPPCDPNQCPRVEHGTAVCTKDSCGFTCAQGYEVSSDGKSCVAKCTPTTCTAQRATCGTIPNGCGGTLECGSCTAPQTCGGGGTANICGGDVCTPKTCTTLKATCGTLPDGCGGNLQCGSCTAPQTCGGGGVANACGFTDPERGVYVSNDGNDLNDGSRAQPLRTIQSGISKAAGLGSDVFVRTGNYPEKLTLQGGVSIFGGYGPDWVRSSEPGTFIDPASPVAVTGNDLGSAVVLDQVAARRAPVGAEPAADKGLREPSGRLERRAPAQAGSPPRATFRRREARVARARRAAAAAAAEAAAGPALDAPSPARPSRAAAAVAAVGAAAAVRTAWAARVEAGASLS